MKKNDYKVYILTICIIFCFSLIGTQGCGGPIDNDIESHANYYGTIDWEDKVAYGVPNDLDLSSPCPANGRWSTNIPDRIAKTQEAAYAFFSTRFYGRVTIIDWLVAIEPVEWTYTGVCTTIRYVTACDYSSSYSGAIIKGYIDPSTKTTNQYDQIYYKGYAVNGMPFTIFIEELPEILYLNTDPDIDGHYHEQVLIPD